MHAMKAQTGIAGITSALDDGVCVQQYAPAVLPLRVRICNM